MLFNSLDYLVFLPVTWTLFWSIRRWRLELLLVASYVFYASWSVPYAALVFGMTVMNYLFGLGIGRLRRHRRALLAACIAVDLGVLGLFKYWDFALGTSWSLGRGLLGLQADPPLLHLVLPLGISFFTFEFIHYLVDIYHGELPVHAFSKFHVFAAFFPTQIAGPIKRFEQFVPALADLRHFDAALALDGVRLIAIGLGKKVLLADRLAPIASRGFSAAADGAIGTTDAWVSSLAFGLQIFFDFSGYTDIARGSAQLFGFRIPLNFNGPYLATSPSDFWRRWHISLSSWLRDYVFIPLGGSRRRTLVIARNLIVTMTIGGLWHGAAWHFVVWGAFWGLVMATHHVLRARLRIRATIATELGGWLITQCIVLLGWVFFRADTFAAAATMLRAMFVFTAGSNVQTASGAALVAGLAAALIATTLALRQGYLRWRPLPLRSFGPGLAGAGVAIALVLVAILAPADRQAFIYFQF